MILINWGFCSILNRSPNCIMISVHNILCPCDTGTFKLKQDFLVNTCYLCVKYLIFGILCIGFRKSINYNVSFLSVCVSNVLLKILTYIKAFRFSIILWIWVLTYLHKCTLLYKMPSNLKGKNFVSKFPGYCPQNTMTFFSSKLDGIKK